MQDRFGNPRAGIVYAVRHRDPDHDEYTADVKEKNPRCFQFDRDEPGEYIRIRPKLLTAEQRRNEGYCNRIDYVEKCMDEAVRENQRSVIVRFPAKDKDAINVLIENLKMREYKCKQSIPSDDDDEVRSKERKNKDNNPQTEVTHIEIRIKW